MKMEIDGKRILLSLPWTAITLASALCLRGLNWGAPAGGLLAHLRYGLVYNLSSNILDFLLLALVCFLLAFLETGGFFSGERRFFLPGLAIAVLFAGNTLIFQSPTGALENLVALPGCTSPENLLHWVSQVGSWYGLSLCFFRWMARPLGVKNEKAPAGKLCLLWAGVMLVLWLPILILRAPGSIYLDTDAQILQFMGKLPWEASNPIFLTLLYGPLFCLGRALGGDNIGILVCVAVQIGLTLFAFSFACREVSWQRGSKRAGWLLCLFFGLMPNFPSFAASVLKDFIHAPLYLLFALYLRRCVREPSKKDMGFLLALAVLCAATRKGAVYLVSACLLGLLWLQKDRRKVLTLAVCGILAGHFCLNGLLLPALGVEKPMEQENYSFFYPITGYYCQRYDGELTQEEKQIISDVLDYETVRTGFSPTGVDTIKQTYHAESSAQVRRYLALHASFFRKHPITCLEALVYSRNYYFTPWASQGERITVGQYPFQKLTNAESSSFSYYLPESIRTTVENELWEVMKAPVLRELTGTGAYTWLSLLLFSAALWQKNRKKEIWLLSVTVLTAGLLLTHLNGALRYASPLIYTAPVLQLLFRADGNGIQE